MQPLGPKTPRGVRGTSTPERHVEGVRRVPGHVQPGTEPSESRTKDATVQSGLRPEAALEGRFSSFCVSLYFQSGTVNHK